LEQDDQHAIATEYPYLIFVLRQTILANKTAAHPLLYFAHTCGIYNPGVQTLVGMSYGGQTSVKQAKELGPQQRQAERGCETRDNTDERK